MLIVSLLELAGRQTLHRKGRELSKVHGALEPFWDVAANADANMTRRKRCEPARWEDDHRVVSPCAIRYCQSQRCTSARSFAARMAFRGQRCRLLDLFRDRWPPELDAFRPRSCQSGAPALLSYIARSKSPKTPSIWNSALPAGVLVSKPC